MKEEFVQFIEQCPTPFHTTAWLKEHFIKKGFSILNESEDWELKFNHSYIIEKNGAFIAFKTPSKKLEKAIFLLSHTDSPGFKIKNQPQKKQQDLEVIGVEVYGAPLFYTWANQTLIPAGVIHTKEGHEVKTHLVKLDNLSSMICPLAIHLDREVNQKGIVFNKQTDLNPLFSDHLSFKKSLEKELNQSILGYDLFLVPKNPTESFGYQEEFLAAYRVDNLSHVFASYLALIKSASSHHCLQMAVFFDHEEIGSNTAEGAHSVFFDDVLKRISYQLTKNFETLFKLKAKSFALSLDVAHAVHPHHSIKHDLESAPMIGKGPVIKFSAGKKYATSAKLASYLELNKKDLSLQHFYPHGEIGSGSTVGPIFSSLTGIQTLDMGIAILGMHAMKEVMKMSDLENLEKILSLLLELEA